MDQTVYKITRKHMAHPCCGATKMSFKNTLQETLRGGKQQTIWPLCIRLRLCLRILCMRRKGTDILVPRTLVEALSRKQDIKLITFQTPL